MGSKEGEVEYAFKFMLIWYFNIIQNGLFNGIKDNDMLNAFSFQ